jgi:hypothetical protein
MVRRNMSGRKRKVTIKRITDTTEENKGETYSTPYLYFKVCCSDKRLLVVPWVWKGWNTCVYEPTNEWTNIKNRQMNDHPGDVLNRQHHVSSVLVRNAARICRSPPTPHLLSLDFRFPDDNPRLLTTHCSPVCDNQGRCRARSQPGHAILP